MSDTAHEHPDTGEEEILPEGAEADLLEQATVVEEQQTFAPPARRDDVPEADWYEQSIGEEPDEDR